VTIPRQVREKLGIEPGTQVTFEVRGDKILVTKAAPSDPVADVYGILGQLDTDRVIARLRGRKG